MAFLAIRRVRYEGRDYSFSTSTLLDGLNVLVGDNGTGKSTFADLIYFGLGGRVDWFLTTSHTRHREVTHDVGNFIELSITIDGSPYTLKRFLGTNDIGVSGDGDVDQILPVYRAPTQPVIFSDWLLGKLGIPSIFLEYGNYSGYLNFTDLARLLYHNQAPDPSAIYKTPDVDSFVSDRLFRQAIFEILVGKSYQAYYSALGELRLAERNLAAAASALALFKQMSANLQRGREDLNLNFLNAKIGELEEQERRLVEYRLELAQAPAIRRPGEVFENQQRDLLAAQIEIARLNRSEAELLDELSKFEQLKADLVLEATQIQKMMFANDELKIFAANTCPYCLKEVTRHPGLCLCGNGISENDYERFFYDSSEYLAILKSRQKNVDTVASAVVDARQELDGVRIKKDTLATHASEIERQIAEDVATSDVPIDLRSFEVADKTLSKVRDELSHLRQQKELEGKRDELEQQHANASRDVATHRARVKSLGAAAEQDIAEKRLVFSRKYEEMMRDTIPGCRRVELGADYMPLINGGEYTEASADVAKRLLFFATMLYMSFIDDSVAFPRFLLIDTPETAGIDPPQLQKILGHLQAIIAFGVERSKPCQVILTTGKGRVPKNCEPAIFAVLEPSDGKRLLIPRPPRTSN